MSRNTWLILRNEILNNVRRPSFFLVSIGLPLLGALIFFGSSLLQDRAGGVDTDPNGSVGSGVEATRVEGYVDNSGLVLEVLPDVPPDTLVPYSDIDAAYQALQNGEIAGYYVVAADYVQSGELLYINPDYSFVNEDSRDWVIRHTLIYNLLGRDMALYRRFWNAMEVQVEAQKPPDRPASDSAAAFYVPYGTAMIFYFVILMAASLLLNSITEEKKNRVLEILLVSVKPREMLTGKILGLGMIGLLQTMIWAGTAYALLRISGRSASIPAELLPPPSILAWGLVFFLLGYALYASLMAGLGALVPSLKDASQATFLIIWPMIIPLFFIGLIIEQPNGLAAIILSLVPFTSPVTMMLRLSATRVPIWQPILAVALLIIMVMLVIRSVARLFRAQILLSGQPVTPKRLYLALLRGE